MKGEVDRDNNGMCAYVYMCVCMREKRYFFYDD